MRNSQVSMETRSPSIGQIFGIIWKRKLYVILGGILGVLIALLLTANLKPKYVSRATLLVDLRQLEITSNTLMPNAPPSLLETLVNSERSLMTSQNVLMQVVDTHTLTNYEEYGGSSGLGLIIGALKSSLGMGGSGKSDPRAVAAAKLRKNLTVQRKKDTLVLAVSVASTDPERARLLTSSILEVYLKERNTSSQAATSKVVSALQTQLSEQVKRLTAAEDAVEQYKIANGIVSAKGQLNDEQQIATVTDQLNNAQLQSAQLRARVTQAKKMLQSGLIASGSLELFKSGLISDLRGRLTAAEEQRASLQSTLGPSHPQMQAVDVRIRSLENSLRSEMRKTVLIMEQELAGARGVEQALGKDLADLRLRSGQTNQKLVPLRELERKVEAARSVYVATLTRIREIRSQQGVDASNVRILSEPSVPLQSEAISRKMLMLLGGMLGASLGALVGFLTSFGRVSKGGTQDISSITGLSQLANLPFAPASIAVAKKMRRRDKNKEKSIAGGGLSLPKLYDLPAKVNEDIGSIEPLYASLRADNNMASPAREILLVASVDDVDSSGYVANLAALACEEGEQVLILVDDEEARPLASFLAQNPSKVSVPSVAVGQGGQQILAVDCCVSGFSQGGRVRQVQRQLMQSKSLFDAYDWVVIDGQGLASSEAIGAYAQLATQIVLLGRDGPQMLEGLNVAYSRLGEARDKVAGFVTIISPSKGSKKQQFETLTLEELPLRPFDLKSVQDPNGIAAEVPVQHKERADPEMIDPQDEGEPMADERPMGSLRGRRNGMRQRDPAKKPLLASSGNALCIRYHEDD